MNTSHEFENRKAYLELIRILAVILVIFHHLDITRLYYHDTQNIVTYIISLLITILVTVDVPLFFMVSGVTLVLKEEPLSKIWTRRIPRILCVLLIFSILQYLFQVLRGKLSAPSVSDFLHRLLSGEIQETYWFLYAYLGFLILLPLIRALVKGISFGQFIYIVILAFLFEIITIFTKCLEIGINTNFYSILSTVSGVLFYAFTGACISKFNEELKEKQALITKLCFVIILLEFLIPALISIICFLTGKGYCDSLIESVGTLLPVVIFLLIKNECENKDTHESKSEKTLLFLGGYTFAIYLTEQFVRTGLLNFYKNLIGTIPGVVNAFLYGILTFIVSLGIAIILKLIPRLKKLL